MATVRAVGFDTSLSAFGMVAAELSLVDGRLRLHFVAGDVVESEPDNQVKRKSDDLLRRFGELARRSWAFVREYDPHVIAVEQAITPVGKYKGRGNRGESPQVAQNLGRARGLVDALAAGIAHVTLFERSAQAIKKATTGDHLAEKESMIAALEEAHPEIVSCYPFRLVRGERVAYKGLREHVADAAGSIFAAFDDPKFREIVGHVLAIADAEEYLDELRAHEARFRQAEGSNQ